MQPVIEATCWHFLWLSARLQKCKHLQWWFLRWRTVVTWFCHFAGNTTAPKPRIKFEFHQIQRNETLTTWDRLTSMSSATSFFFLAYLTSCLGWQLVQFMDWQLSLGEARIKVTSRWKPRNTQVQLHTRAESSRKFLCFEMFAWDQLASRIYAATATTCLMKFWITVLFFGQLIGIAWLTLHLNNWYCYYWNDIQVTK